MEPPRFFPKLDRRCAQATANLASSPSIERTTCLATCTKSVPPSHWLFLRDH